jgi:hypothetical protein
MKTMAGAILFQFMFLFALRPKIVPISARRELKSPASSLERWNTSESGTVSVIRRQAAAPLL